MKNNELKFSVLMSLYNKENPKYLRRCFKSLYDQELRGAEVVCVFDGEISSDLEKAVLEWKDRLNIHIVKSSSNIGLGRALNLGMQHCSNNIIARMDTDDIAMSDRFSTQIPQFIDNPGLILSGSNIIEFEDDEFTPSGIRTVPTKEVDIKEYSKVKNPFNHMTVAFRMDAIQKVGGYIHHPFMEDYNLWLRVICAGYCINNINRNLVKARVGRGMLARRAGLKYIKSEFQLAILKYKLRLQSPFSAFVVFLIRSAPRILPVTILSLVYKLNRNNK